MWHGGAEKRAGIVQSLLEFFCVTCGVDRVAIGKEVGVMRNRRISKEDKHHVQPKPSLSRTSVPPPRGYDGYTGRSC